MLCLPAEHRKDPTGIGIILGLTEMGKVRQQLEAAAQADAVLHGGEQSSLMSAVFGLFTSAAHAQKA